MGGWVGVVDENEDYVLVRWPWLWRNSLAPAEAGYAGDGLAPPGRG